MTKHSAADWQSSKRKSILLFGMSGLGKTHISNMLRDEGDWFHYSVDYRIGTRYMGEHIVDNFKYEAMKTPFLRDLLRSDSIYIESNITFNNLAPLSTYLGKPGDPSLGGLGFEEYQRRQDLHKEAEVAALLDTEHFISRAHHLYGYENFVCDTGGSICEVVNPDDPHDPVMTELAKNHILIWIEGSDDHTEELVRRFDRAPKPMCYQTEFLEAAWTEYLTSNNTLPEKVNPDDFVRWTYARALAHRHPRYQKMAETWGITIKAEDISMVKDGPEFLDLVGTTLENQSN